MTADKQLPGTTGLPLVGETLRFIADPWHFVSDRTAKHGNVFRTHLLGKPCAVVSGPAAAALFIDHDKIQRQGSQPDNIFRLFAGPSVPHLDGEAHTERKAILMQAFTRSALTAYLPAMQTHVEQAFTGWAGQSGEIGWMAELQRLAIESVCGSILGDATGPRIQSLRQHYRTIDRAFTGVPINLPGTAYSAGLRAIDSILAIYREFIAEHRRAPSEDGLSRLLGHTTAKGTKLTDDEAAREMHHLIIAGRIVWSHLATLILELESNPDVARRLDEEVHRLAPSGPLTVENLHELVYLDAVVREVKRVSPVVPGLFGLAKRDIEFEGHRIPKGWMLLLGLRSSHQMADVYRDPERFDPNRFIDRHEPSDPNGFFPHGPGKFMTSHHCAGTDYATVLTQVFAIVLSRGYRWTLPEQRLTYRWAQLTPEPIDGLRAIVGVR